MKDRCASRSNLSISGSQHCSKNGDSVYGYYHIVSWTAAAWALVSRNQGSSENLRWRGLCSSKDLLWVLLNTGRWRRSMLWWLGMKHLWRITLKSGEKRRKATVGSIRGDNSIMSYIWSRVWSSARFTGAGNGRGGRGWMHLVLCDSPYKLGMEMDLLKLEHNSSNIAGMTGFVYVLKDVSVQSFRATFLFFGAIQNMVPKVDKRRERTQCITQRRPDWCDLKGIVCLRGGVGALRGGVSAPLIRPRARNYLQNPQLGWVTHTSVLGTAFNILEEQDDVC